MIWKTTRIYKHQKWKEEDQLQLGEVKDHIEDKNEIIRKYSMISFLNYRKKR